jgi:peptidoglycan hydrolase CwlO-like protein
MSDNENELEEQLADARAQIEALQASAADAEARAATARDEITAAKGDHDALRTQLAEAEGRPGRGARHDRRAGVAGG